MPKTQISLKSIVVSLLIGSSLNIALPTVSTAQSNSGLTLFSGVSNRSDILNYYLDFGGRADSWDRYRLRIPARKIQLGITQLKITYPDYFDGEFNPNQMEVRVDGKPLALTSSQWDKEAHSITFNLVEPYQGKKGMEIVLSDVKNPYYGGTFYFNCEALTVQGATVPSYVGTWIVSIGF